MPNNDKLLARYPVSLRNAAHAVFGGAGALVVPGGGLHTQNVDHAAKSKSQRSGA